jgi:hypothetical protein
MKEPNGRAKGQGPIMISTTNLPLIAALQSQVAVPQVLLQDSRPFESRAEWPMAKFSLLADHGRVTSAGDSDSHATASTLAFPG